MLCEYGPRGIIRRDTNPGLSLDDANPGLSPRATNKGTPNGVLLRFVYRVLFVTLVAPQSFFIRSSTSCVPGFDLLSAYSLGVTLNCCKKHFEK